MNKKKVFSYLFLGLLAVGATGTVTSCKDYDDDINANTEQINKLQENVTSLESALNSAKTDLQSQIAAATQDYTSKIAAAQASLQAAIDKKADQETVSALAKNVADLTTDMNAKISALNTQLGTINEAIAGLQSTLNTKVDQDAFNTAINELKQSIENNGSDITKLKEQYEALSNGKADKSEVEALKNSLEASIADLQSKKADKTTVEALQALVNDLQDNKLDKTDFETYKTATQGLIDALEARVKNLEDNAATKAELANEVSALNGLISANSSAIQQINEALTGKVNTSDFQDFTDKYDAAVRAYELWKGEINDQVEKLQTANQKVYTDFSDSLDVRDALIDQLNNQVAALNAFKNTVTDPKSGYQAQIDNLEQSLGASAATNYKTLDERADSIIGALKVVEDSVKNYDLRISDLKSRLTNINNELGERISNEVSTMTLLVEQSLTSLVLKPGYYFGGIEAVEVPALENVPTEVLVDAKKELTGDETWKAATGYGSTVSEMNDGVATYHVNPTVADLKGYSFDFYGNDPKVVAETRAGLDIVSAKYKTYEEAEKAGFGKSNGLISVPFTLNNSVYNNIVKSGKTPMIALQMSKKASDGQIRTVTSDYALINSTKYTKLILAVGDKDFKDEQATISNLKAQDLYGQAEGQTVAQLTNTPSAYTYVIGVDGKESIDLNALVETHYPNEEGAHSAMNAETFKNLGLQYQFDLVKNQRNNFKHTEGDYATLKNGVVSVNEELKAVAAGHQPIVRVLLKTKDGKILKHGYIKLQISKFAYPISGVPYEAVKPVTCDGVSFGDLYLDGPVKDLANKNDMEPSSYIKSVDLDKNSDNSLKQYTFDKDGQFVEIAADKAVGTITTSLGAEKLNKVVYPYEGGDKRDSIIWSLPKTVTDTITVNAEGKNIYPLVTYVRVTNNNSLNSFIRLTIPAGAIVKPVATIKADSKVAARWYQENGGQSGVGINDLTEIHINTQVPGIAGNEANITYNLDESFQSKTPQFTLNDAFKNKTVSDWEYKFITKPGAKNWIVTGASGTQYEIKVANEGKSLSATTVGEVKGNGAKATDHVFVNLTGTHNAQVNVVTKNTDKQNRAVYDIINAYGHKQLAEGETFKVYIGVTATVECQKANAGTFTARILRPIDLVAAANKPGTDAVDGGQKITVTDLFKNPTDWRDKWENSYWDYYGVDVDADVENSLTDAALTESERTAYEPGTVDAAKIKLLGTVANANLDFTKSGTGRTAQLIYKNNGATIGSFHIYVPLTVTYYWGYKWTVGYARLDIANTVNNAKRK